VSEKVCKHHHPAKWQIAKQAFHLIVVAITKAKVKTKFTNLLGVCVVNWKFAMLELWFQDCNLTMLMLW